MDKQWPSLVTTWYVYLVKLSSWYLVNIVLPPTEKSANSNFSSILLNPCGFVSVYPDTVSHVQGVHLPGTNERQVYGCSSSRQRLHPGVR